MKTFQDAKDIVQRAIDIFHTSNGLIRPHVLLTGTSGSGKTYLAETLANSKNLPFLEINGAQLTNEGMSGNSLSKALVPLKNYGDQLNVIFVDEIDKLFVNGEDLLAGREVKIGVQNELLKIIEGRSTDVIGDYGKYQTVTVSNTLFIFAGAFNNTENVTYDTLRDFGLRNEFIGRLGVLVHVPRPTVEHIAATLPDNLIFQTYCKMFQVNKEQVFNYIMAIIAKYHNQNNLGLRLVNTLLHAYFMNKGNIPEEVIRSICITKPTVLIDFNIKQKETSLGTMSFGDET